MVNTPMNDGFVSFLSIVTRSSEGIPLFTNRFSPFRMSEPVCANIKCYHPMRCACDDINTTSKVLGIIENI